MNIINIGNSIIFDDGKLKHVFPLNSIIMISNDDSNIINVRLKASRKNVLTFNYNDVENIEATSANNLLENISLIANAISSGGGGISEDDEALINDIKEIIG